MAAAAIAFTIWCHCPRYSQIESTNSTLELLSKICERRSPRLEQNTRWQENLTYSAYLLTAGARSVRQVLTGRKILWITITQDTGALHFQRGNATVGGGRSLNA